MIPNYYLILLYQNLLWYKFEEKKVIIYWLIEFPFFFLFKNISYSLIAKNIWHIMCLWWK